MSRWLAPRHLRVAALGADRTTRFFSRTIMRSSSMRPTKVLPEADAVAEERSVEVTGYGRGIRGRRPADTCRAAGTTSRAVLIPLVGCEGLASKELVQGLFEPDFEWAISENGCAVSSVRRTSGCHVLGFVPVALVPVLQKANFRAANDCGRSVRRLSAQGLGT